MSVLLVSDIAGFTQQLASDGGDARVHQLDSHRRSVREALKHHQGQEVDTVGDGFLARFSWASRAVACATEMITGVVDEGIHLGIGLHAGEVTIRTTGVTGMAAHITARISALAHADEILFSVTVATMLVGVTRAPQLEGVGERELKGVPGSWRLHRTLVKQTGINALTETSCGRSVAS